MKTTYFSTLCLCLVINLHSFAQEALFSQYNQNPLFINPAAAGTSSANELMLGYRNQWNGFEGSPKTLFLGCYYTIEGNQKYIKRNRIVLITSIGTNFNPNGKDTLNVDTIPKKTSILQGISKTKRMYLAKMASNKHVWGGILTYDTYGIFRRFNLGVSYNYHLPIDSKHRLVLGVMPMLFQTGIDQSVSNSDQSIVNYNSKTLVNIKVGTWFYAANYFAGFSVANIFKDNINTPTYYLTGGYKFELEREIDLTPTVLLKSGNTTDVQLDVNLQATYNKLFYGSIGLRTNQVLLLNMGYTWKQLKFNYAVDVPYTSTNRIANVSHEIWLSWAWK